MSAASPARVPPAKGWSRRRATVVTALAVWFVTAWWSAPAATRPLPTSPGSPPQVGDVQFYAAQVEAMRRGSPYYDVASAGLRAGGYPMRSVFNWRPPLLPTLLATITPAGGRLLLAILGGLLLWHIGALQRREPLAILPMANTVLGLLVPAAIYFGEAWAGACLGLSVLAYARDRYRRGAAWALAGLFVRELAGPFCLVAACAALYHRRRRELLVWAIGGGAYVISYAVHARQVLAHIRPDDRAQDASWLAFGGLRFLLDTWRTNGLFLVAPPIVVALLAVSVVVAWWSRHLPGHARGLLLLYSVSFLVVGQPFNGYWGLLIAPAVSVWLAHSPEGFRTLWGSTRAGS